MEGRRDVRKSVAASSALYLRVFPIEVARTPNRSSHLESPTLVRQLMSADDRHIRSGVSAGGEQIQWATSCRSD
jgi:hypothetical protein